MGALPVSIHLILPPKPARMFFKIGLSSAINFLVFYYPPKAVKMASIILLYILGTQMSCVGLTVAISSFSFKIFPEVGLSYNNFTLQSCQLKPRKEIWFFSKREAWEEWRYALNRLRYGWSLACSPCVPRWKTRNFFGKAWLPWEDQLFH